MNPRPHGDERRPYTQVQVVLDSNSYTRKRHARRRLAHVDVDLERARRCAAVGAVDGTYVGVVAADGDLHVALVRDTIVRGVVAGPAMARDVRFDPGVRRLDFTRAAGVVEKISA